MSALRGDAGQESDHTVGACASPPDVGATTRRRLIAGGLSFGAAAALASFAPANALAQGKQPGADELTPPAPRSIEVRARPIEHFDLRDRARRQFGVLQFRSGLILTSSFRGFGGLSGLRLDPRGERFVAISDKATWFTGRIVYAGSVMTGLADVEAAPLLAADGAPFRARKWYDSESLAFDGGTAYVGFERVNQIVKFEFGHGGVRSRGQPIAIPPALRKLPNNKGIEALVMVPRPHPLSGTLIAVSERGLDAARNTIGFLIGGRTPGQFAIHRTANYDIADAALLPDGDLLILERKFSWIEGVHIRIRRIALRAILPGTTVDGPAIFEADLGHEIDNMEALDVHLDEEGAIVLTMLSDDNFSMLQRTLLLQFSLIPD